MRIASLLLALPILVASCGGSADPSALTKDGETALGNHDAATAASNFDDALALIGADNAHPMYLRAKLGLAESFAGTNPGKSKSILEALQKDLPGKATAKEFIRVMNAMAASTAEGAEKITVDTLTFALANFPNDKVALDEIGAFLLKKAAESGNVDAASALDGLGYTGSD